ncbi:predicted membrane protein [Longilinea arvoryzae]|uniref:Predicted membrane protein n=1 Tax=Longilinea arvoryzae TaxID=360412 RepID=A0A0S7BG33_9CHLR|nr:PrsW family intramembrane metalloprotease [Longilinea arvoryzae]GAP14541.1 predicted membrane protein [Longilinea arvoryzae]
MPLILSLLFGFLPMFLFATFVYWLDRYEKEPRLLLGAVFLWGAVVAAGAAYILNTGIGMGVYMVTHSEAATEVSTTSLVAPVIEESFKGLAVLLVFWLAHREFDSILDGIVYAAVTALGFAATENAYYIYNLGYLEGGFAGLFQLAFIRVVLVGWQHPFYTSFIGIGLAAARLNRNPSLRILLPLLGLAASIFTHALHNTMAQFLTGMVGLAVTSMADWIGWLFLLGFIVYMIWRENQLLQHQLNEEVQLGIITGEQYHSACSFWRRTGGLFTSRRRKINRFYQVCAELSHKKNQLTRMGDEHGNGEIIADLRGELQQLSIGLTGLA